MARVSAGCGIALGVAALVTSVVWLPLSMVVGAVAAPVLLFKSIWHKSAVEYHAFRAGYKINANDITSIDPHDPNSLKHVKKQVDQKIKLIRTSERTKTAALCILPLGYFAAVALNVSNRDKNNDKINNYRDSRKQIEGMLASLELKSIQKIQSPPYIFDQTNTTYDRLCLIREDVRKLKYQNSPEVAGGLIALRNQLKIHLNTERGDFVEVMGGYAQVGVVIPEVGRMKAEEKIYYEKCKRVIDEI